MQLENEIEMVDVPRERVIIGALLRDGAFALEQCVALRAEMLGINEHRMLFARITAILRDSEQVDALMVMDVLKARGEAHLVTDGIAGLMAFEEGVPRKHTLSSHVARIIDRWKVRAALSACDRLRVDLETHVDAAEAIGRLQAAALDLATDTSSERDPNLSALTIPALERWKASDAGMGLPYGIAPLDSVTGGLKPGQVTVVAARSGIGKSALMLQTIAHNCRAGVPAELFSLEMSGDEILARLWGLEADVPQRVMFNPTLATPEQRRSVSQAAMRVADWPLRIHDASVQDVDVIAAQVRVGVNRHGTRLFAVDYAQRVSADARDERLKVARVSSTLTAVAKDTGASALVLAQLAKATGGDENKPPSESEIRESGQLVNDAHVILMLHRGRDHETGKRLSLGEINVSKLRFGEGRAIPVRFDGRSCTFETPALTTARAA